MSPVTHEASANQVEDLKEAEFDKTSLEKREPKKQKFHKKKELEIKCCSVYHRKLVLFQIRNFSLEMFE